MQEALGLGLGEQRARNVLRGVLGLGGSRVCFDDPAAGF